MKSTWSWDSIPKRWQLILLLHTGFIIEYCLRVNMSVAVVDMKREFSWTDDQRGVMLSSFYCAICARVTNFRGYAFGQLPSNYIVQKTKAAKWTFACSIFFASILTILLPVAAHMSFEACLVVRALTGLAESAAFPSAYNMYPNWVPESEKTVMITCVMSGMYLGEIFCFLISGYLVVSSFTVGGVEVGGWNSVFWVFGLFGVLWCPIWVRCTYETPLDHPYISTEELGLLVKSQQQHRAVSTEEDDADADDDEEEERDVRGGDCLDAYGGGVALYEDDTEDELYDKACDEDYRLVLEMSSPASTASFTHNTDGPDICDHHHHQLPKHLRDYQSISAGRDRSVVRERKKRTASVVYAPWLAFFTHPASVTLIVCFWTQNWIGYLILSELPTFFTEELQFGLKDAGIWSMAPYIAQFCSTLIFGIVFQYLQKNHDWSTQRVRQYAQHICFFGASGCLLCCGFTDKVPVAIFLMITALGFYGSCQSGIACAFLDVSPRFSSTLNSTANVFGSLAGVVSPLIVSAFTDRYEGVWGWRYVFILTFFQCLFSSLLWYNYQTSTVVNILNTPMSSTKSVWDPIQKGVCSIWYSRDLTKL